MPLVCLHGVTDSWRSFEPLFVRLPPTIRVLALTQRGHGRSSKPAEGYTYTDLSEDVRAFMDALHLPQAVIVGHSMGSLVAQRLAVDHPERVAGLVLLGAFRSLHRSPVIQEFCSALSTIEDPMDPALRQGFSGQHAGARGARRISRDGRRGKPSGARTRLARGVPRLSGDPDFSAALARVRVPALILWGDGDTYSPAADQEALRAAIPGARLIIYSGGGHAFHWEDPAQVAHDLVAFLYERRAAEQAQTERAHERVS